MNLLTINPISSCNISCEHCPNKEWTYPIGDERNRLTNKIIFKWLEKYFNPREWLLEVSGGEPGLYPEIQGLITGLCAIGYRGIIRTNGTLPIPKTDNFKRIAAWHKPISIACPPKYCDVMLITKNPDDCWEEKSRHCLVNNIPHKCVPYVRFGDPALINEPPQGDIKTNTYFKYWTIVNSYGEQAFCYANWGGDGDNILNMAPPLLWDLNTCPSCHGIIGTIEFCLECDLLT
ncbi:MAG: hypothetical protein FWG91_13855 [Lachnospiraceae bacterium]|nr:hypothetical protein [Lachnospiraceae bacterium]